MEGEWQLPPDRAVSCHQHRLLARTSGEHMDSVGYLRSLFARPFQNRSRESSRQNQVMKAAEHQARQKRLIETLWIAALISWPCCREWMICDMTTRIHYPVGTTCNHRRESEMMDILQWRVNPAWDCRCCTFIACDLLLPSFHLTEWIHMACDSPRNINIKLLSWCCWAVSHHSSVIVTCHVTLWRVCIIADSLTRTWLWHFEIRGYVLHEWLLFSVMALILAGLSLIE